LKSTNAAVLGSTKIGESEGLVGLN
jgi:hypothetical protein